MTFTKLARELSNALYKLQMTQAQFAAKVGLSQAFIAKMLKGEGAKADSYRKLFQSFKEDLHEDHGQASREIALDLLRAYIQDLIDNLGLRDDEFDTIDLFVNIGSSQLHSLGDLFVSFDADILLALYVLACKSRENRNYNLIMSTAASMSSNDEAASEFFTSNIRKGKRKGKGALLAKSPLAQIYTILQKGAVRHKHP